MEHTKENTDTRSLPQFQVLFIVSQVIGIIAIVLTTIWSSKYWGGFGFEDANLEFNFHPPFMVALVYLCGNGILIFRGLRFKKKTPLKWIHTVFHWISLIVCGFALFTVIDFHNRKNFANFYSLHSWIGIFVSAVYFIQFFSSFVIFMIPCIPYSVRKLAMQFHVFGGLFILILLIGKWSLINCVHISINHSFSSRLCNWIYGENVVQKFKVRINKLFFN